MAAGSIYSTARWARVRARQLARKPLCEMCGELGLSVPRPARHVDHIMPISTGGAPFDPANLQSLCIEHHSLKTTTIDRTGASFDRWRNRGCHADGTPRDPEHAWNQADEHST